MKPYERLSQLYDFAWGQFSLKYVPLIQDLLEERGISHTTILDLACGTGILAVELARRGHVVHGIDCSAEMVCVARAKLIGLPNLTFEVQDMTKCSFDRTFNLATCTFDSINYLLEPDALRAMFSHIAEALEETGLFIFDLNTPQLYSHKHHGRLERTIGGEIIVQELSYDAESRIAQITFKFQDAAVEVHIQRAYELREIEPLLTAAYFEIVSVFSGFDRSAYTAESERLICVTEKRSGYTRAVQHEEVYQARRRSR